MPQTEITSDERVAELRRLLNEIVDPCSHAATMPIGLVDMGIVQQVEFEDGTARIGLLPTFPGCRFVPIFEEEIDRRVAAVPWVRRVVVNVAAPDEIWDESRMTEAGRVSLAQRRRARSPHVPIGARSRSGERASR
jgi:metal-sulfur cluster biosynthetic enzyme